mmetsp:Transcript_57608/g.128548  ORF Transcript_57608/g.128548 Transcript_57608/m.128548 type:complete len:305 (-) Transcript_57608:601-1515(-)
MSTSCQDKDQSFCVSIDKTRCSTWKPAKELCLLTCGLCPTAPHPPLTPLPPAPPWSAEGACYARRYPDLLAGFCGGVITQCDWKALRHHFDVHGADGGRTWGCDRPVHTPVASSVKSIHSSVPGTAASPPLPPGGTVAEYLNRPQIKAVLSGNCGANCLANLSSWAKGEAAQVQDEVTIELDRVKGMSHSLGNASALLLEAAVEIEGEVEALWSVAPVLFAAVAALVLLCCACVCWRCSKYLHGRSGWSRAPQEDEYPRKGLVLGWSGKRKQKPGPGHPDTVLKGRRGGKQGLTFSRTGVAPFP